MNRCKLYLAALSLTFISTSIPSAFAQTVIAHRGLFHDSVTYFNLPENTSGAVLEARNIGGLGGAEVDLRTSQDGVVMVTHDQISNRTTEYDNDGGSLNPVYVSIGSQNSVSAIHIYAHPASYWQGAYLKNYEPGAHLVGTAHHMETLDGMLDTLRNEGILSGNFKLILDIQTPDIFSKAAKSIISHGVQGNVYLKFFAKSALYNNLTYNGSDTCYVYMEQNNLANSGLKIIPQINDGELDIDENDNAGISVWGTTLTIPEYLNCWADAQTQHPSNTADMPIVSASVPADNSSATQAASAAISWARSNHRETMSIIPNPDACYVDGNAQREYSFSSSNVSAFPFNYTARTAKSDFVAKNSPTYVIVDVMGNKGTSWTTDITSYNNGLCTGSN